MNAPIYKVSLENKGQDFRTFYVQGGTIIHVEPPECASWRGKRLSAAHFKPGDDLSLESRMGAPARVKLPYRAETVAILQPSTFDDEALNARTNVLLFGGGGRDEGRVSCPAA